MSKRVALVIGNQEYGENARPLMGPVNDAIRMACLFEDMGFVVVQPQFNADYGTIRAAVRGFVETIEEGGLAVFYYSGHGIQGLGGINYLMPVDAKLYEPVDIDGRCYAVSSIVQKLTDKRCTGLLFLDACRDDPFRGIPDEERTKSVVVQKKGLKKVEKSALPDILISYATGPGNTARDGDPDESSPYTQALIKHLPTPGVSIEEVLKRVRKAVAKDTEYRQQPSYDGQLVSSELMLVSPLAGGKEEEKPPEDLQLLPDVNLLPEKLDLNGATKDQHIIDPPRQYRWWQKLLIIGVFFVPFTTAMYIGYNTPDPLSKPPELLFDPDRRIPGEIVRTDASVRVLALLGDINADDANVRRAATARIEASLIGANSLNAADRLAIANGLVRMASDLSRRGLSSQGRFNLFYLLGRIDKSDWEQRSWAVARAAARRAFLDLKTSGTDIGQQTTDVLNALGPLLFVEQEERPLVVIYANVRYRGSLTQEHALSAMGALRALNWEVRGPNGAEDATQAAIGKNEVRYGNVSDREIAAKAVLDLQAAGYAVAANPVQVARFGTGPIEIWLSKLPETAQERWLNTPPSSAWCFQREGPVTDGGRFSVRCHKETSICTSVRQQSIGIRSSACVFVAELDRSGVTLQGGGTADSYFRYGREPFSTPFPPMP